MQNCLFALFCCVSFCSAQMVVPVDAHIQIAGQSYLVQLTYGLVSGVDFNGTLHLTHASADSLCAVDGHSGLLRVSSTLTPKQQAKALVHEVVHIAQTCDLRDLSADERIAQDLADLFDSKESGFLMKELTQ
jgi:hypothetical protein